MHRSLVTVPAAAALSMLYARMAASLVGPGLCRLLALAPVLALLLVLPLASPLYSARGFAAFTLAWLGEFKLLLLASGRGPLDPALPPVQFVFTGALPVKLRIHKGGPDDHAAAEEEPLLLSSLSTRFAVTVALLHVLRGGKDRMHPYMASAIYDILTYCGLNFVLPCIAAAGRALGMDLEPQFDRPYLSASLQNFWGRRWNTMASAVLRAAVYDPVRARVGTYVGVLATFLVSGLMHEVVAYYITFRAPTGQLTAFFLLHGASVCAEKWCARRRPAGARPPRVLATPLVLGFVAATAFWLFFPPLFGDGMDDRYIAEIMALLSSVVDAMPGLAR